MRKLAIALTAAAVVLSAGLSAQGKPNFAGKWTLQQDPNAAPPAGGGGAAGAGGAGQRGGGGGGGRGAGGGAGFACGADCSITQDATTLTVTRTTPAGETKSMFKLDGSDSKNSITMGQGMTMDAVSKATWEGSKLVISTSVDMNGNAVTSKATLSLDASGNLVVEREGGRGPMAPQTYKKS